MEMNEFIKHFGDQFDDTDVSTFTPETRFRELEEWSSLNALAVLNMIGKKYGIKINKCQFFDGNNRIIKMKFKKTIMSIQ